MKCIFFWECEGLPQFDSIFLAELDRQGLRDVRHINGTSSQKTINLYYIGIEFSHMVSYFLVSFSISVFTSIFH